MSFSELLNKYIAEIGCSAKELSEVSGISAAAISRYRTGERTPDLDGKQLRMIATGLSELSRRELDEQALHEELAASISGLEVDYDTFLSNVSSLLNALSVSNIELARALSFDPSYISRILTGQRRPADLQSFIGGISEFAARRCMQEGMDEPFVALIGESLAGKDDEEGYAEAISVWLSTNYTPPRDSVGHFLEKLDAFDLDDFIRAVHFDDMKVPTVPFQLPTTKTYTGIREMMNCEIDFLKAAVLSKSSASVILYSDMPLDEMAADEEFPKKWMYGMAMLLKKGLHLHMIHETNRPLHEMMLGLEGWIPMYMTGQISPYYFEQPRDSVFRHIIRVSGSIAMQGEAIKGHQGEGRYILTKSRDEVRYYRKRAERMLENARPLMRIMTEKEAGKLATFMEESSHLEGRRRIMATTPPLGAIPPELLDSMLDRANVSGEEREKINAFAKVQKNRLERLMANNEVRFEYPSITSEEYESHSESLALSFIFREEPIQYTYDEYCEHMEAFRVFVEKHEGCSLVMDRRQPFRNIQIIICEGDHVIVSKSKGPAIHFIIEHPSMIAAFERFTAPVVE